MSHLLHIDSSLRTEGSRSRRLSAHYAERWLAAHPGGTVTYRDLADTLGEAVQNNPRSYAVLVRNHGVYVWGKDWQQAKTHAECYDYLFAAAARRKQLGIAND